MPIPGTRSRAAIALAVLLLLASAAAWQTGRRRAPHAAPPASRPLARSIAILGFHNASVAADAWIAAALTELVRADLEDVVRVVDAAQATAGLADLGLSALAELQPPQIDALGRRLDADHALLGVYSRTADGGALKVRYQLVRVGQSERVAASGEEAADDAELPRLAARLVQRLSLAAAPPTRVSDGEELPDREAVRLYSTGVQRLEQFDALGARELLEAAVRADPDFPMAHAALSGVWSTLGYDSRATDAARRAYDLSTGLSRRRQMLVEARWHEAARNWTEAARLHAGLHRLAPDNEQYAIKLAEALAAAGRGSEAHQTLERFRGVRPGSENPRLDLAEARVAEYLGDAPRLVAAATRAATAAESRNERLFAAEARLLQCYGHQSVGQTEQALVSCEIARSGFQAAGHRGGVARALTRTADVLRYRGDLPRSRQLTDEALALAREIGDVRTTGAALNRLASVDAEEGHLRRALGLYGETHETWQRVGDRSRATSTLNNVGTTLLQLGDLHRAREALTAAAAEALAIGDRRAQCFVGFNLGLVLAEQGELAEARRTCADALLIGEQIRFRSGEAMAHACLGRAARLAGDLDEARTRHDRALALRRELNEAGRAAESELALAELDLLQGRSDDAARAASALAKRFEATASGHHAVAALVVAARAAAELGRLPAARAELRRLSARAARLEHVAPRVAVELARAAVDWTKPSAARLRALANDAQRRGAVPAALEARLLLLEHAAADPAWLPEALSLENDASRHGLKALAQRAASLRERRRADPR